MQTKEEKSVLSISKYNILSQVASLSKLKCHQNFGKGIIKGRCKLKPIGNLQMRNLKLGSNLTENKNEKDQDFSLAFSKKPLVHKNLSQEREKLSVKPRNRLVSKMKCYYIDLPLECSYTS